MEPGRSVRPIAIVGLKLAVADHPQSIDRLRKNQVKDRTAQAAFAEEPRVDTSQEGVRNVLYLESTRGSERSSASFPTRNVR